MNVLSIINESRELAQIGALHESQVTSDGDNAEYLSMLGKYNLYLDELTDSRPWLYAHDMSTALTELSEDADTPSLGYAHRYLVGSDTETLAVLAINGQTNARFKNVVPNFQQALRAGIVYLPNEDSIRKPDKGFVFVNGVLHSDVPVTSCFIKKRINVATAPASFKKYLIYTLAAVLAGTRKENSQRESELEAKLPSLAMKAIRDEQSFKSNPHYDTIISYINDFYTHAYILGHGTRQ